MIDIPKNIKLELKHGKLQNNINYVVIKDGDDGIANVGIGIKTGSIADPKEYMGMAHFLEHMLFLGSKKFKEESYFDTIVKQYGGYSNAYTTLFETVYYFNVLVNHLDEVFDVFSRFFIDPLFDVNSVSREINAINSEHMKNINNEYWIMRQLLYDLTDNDNILHRFTTGSHETFGKDYKKLRENMIDFYNKYYTSDNLYIVVQSNMDINIMDDMIHKYFGMIESKQAASSKLNWVLTQNNDGVHNLYPKYSIKNKEYQLIPSQDSEYITYFWDLNSCEYYRENNVIDVIDNIITSKCKNNIYDTLIKTLCVDYIDSSYMDEGIFKFTVYMIKNGDVRSNIIKINNIVANYFNDLINLPKKCTWAELYDKSDKLSNFIYNNSKKPLNEDVMMDIITNMMYYKTENIYNGDKIIIKKDYDKLYETIKILEFKNASIIYCTKTELDKGEFLIEPYYNKEYKPLKYGFIKHINKIQYNFNADIELIDINPINIPNLNTPIPIKYNENTWYGGLSKFNEPFARLNIILRNDNIFNTITTSVISNIAINVINYYLSIYFCQYFNLDYNVILMKQNSYGLIVLVISGYNDKFDEFVKMVLTKMKEIVSNIDDKIIQLYCNKYKEILEKKKTQTSWAYADMIAERIYDYNYDYMDQLNILPKININMIKKRIKTIISMKKFNITNVWYGNIENKIIFDIKGEDVKYNKIIPKKINDVIIKHPNKNEKNNCVAVYLPCTEHKNYMFNPLETSKIIILASMLEQPVYGELRTKHQLGYMVSSYIFNDNINMYIVIKVQSDKKVSNVKNKIYNFIEEFKDMIISYDEDKFNKIKKSVYGKLMEPFSNITDINMFMLTEIKKEQYIFDRKEKIAKEIENITLNDIIKLYHSIILKSTNIIITPYLKQ